MDYSLSNGIPYRLIRSKRRTLAIQVQRDGTVVIRAPMRTALRRIQSFAERHSDWIFRSVQKMRHTAAAADPVLTADEIERLRAEALQDFTNRVLIFRAQVGVTVGRITIRCQKTRWGSCSSSGNLSFNLLLMLAPPDVRDYIVVHELCHRLEMNHSSGFWAAVAQVLPKYRTAIDWLRVHGPEIMARRPSS